jgi:hypothetical protein
MRGGGGGGEEERKRTRGMHERKAVYIQISLKGAMNMGFGETSERDYAKPKRVIKGSAKPD